MSLTEEGGLSLRGLILAAFLLLLIPLPGSSQISGRILDQAGNPITFALVELVGSSGVLASGRSNARGLFDLAPVPTATEVRGSQFGFGTESVSLDDLTKPLVLVLAPQPFQLEEIRAVSPEASCPSHEEPAARVAWLNVLSRIRDLSQEVVWGAYLVEWRRSRGLDSDFGRLQEPSYDWVSYHASSDGLSRRWTRDGGNDLGLARLRSDGDLGSGAGIAWQIPSLYGPGVPILFDPALAAQSTIAWSKEGKAVVLCHEDARGVKTRLAAALGDSGDLTDIVWKLETPDPVEKAGGQITFLPSSRGQVLPLPVTTYFWFREEGGRNSQDYRTFSPWVVGASDDEVIHALVQYRDSLNSGLPEH